MKIKRFLILLSISLFFVFNLHAAELNVDVDLSPAGDFVAKTTSIKGTALKMNKNGKDFFAAKNIEIDLRTIKTGVSLRDKHLKKYLEVDKYPKATLIKAQGANGKGIALINIKGKKIKVKGQLEVKGNQLTAHFPITLTELGIEGVRYMGVGVKDKLQVHVTVPVAAHTSMRTPAKNGK